MRRIAIINQKGGVGKTTTTINLASGCAKRGLRTLILDLDGQGNVSTALQAKGGKDMYALLVEKENPESCATKVRDNLFLIPSTNTLQKAEIIMSGQTARETILRRAMENIRGYDFIFLDCPPSLSLLNQNALLYAQEAFIPASTDFLGFDAVKKMLKEIDTINNIFSHDCEVRLIIPTMYDSRNKTCREHLKRLREEFNGTPIADPIRMNSKLKEMPMKGKSIFDMGASHGADDYLKLVERVLKQKAIA